MKSKGKYWGTFKRNLSEWRRYHELGVQETNVPLLAYFLEVLYLAFLIGILSFVVVYLVGPYPGFSAGNMEDTRPSSLEGFTGRVEE